MNPRLFHNGKVQLYAGDCMEVLSRLSDNCIDAVVTDPPYHLTSMVKRFGKANAEKEIYAATSKSAYMSRGFMGKQWDGGDIAFRPGLWAEVLRVLKPGGHMVCFGGTRTYHRLACAIEDAGFDVRDAIMWHYGSGFPKSHDVSKGIDRTLGAEREILKERPAFGIGGNQTFNGHSEGATFKRTEPSTDAARQWQSYGTALKPATEIVCLARKPLSESTVAANVLRWGTGALNIDGCRIAGEVPSTIQGQSQNQGTIYGSDQRDQRKFIGNSAGRWPANLCHDGSPEVLAGFPETSPSPETVTRGPSDSGHGSSNRSGEIQEWPCHGDSGSAARFFASFPSENEVKCSLCNALTAALKFSTADTQTASFVHCDAVDWLPQENEDTWPRGNGTANNAVDRSSVCRAPTNGAAPENAPTWPDSKIVQNVKSAAILCDSCAIGIAQGLAEVRRCRNVELVRFQDFISGHNAPILIHHLALYVVGREGTDTILTIPSLKLLFGSVFHAIASATDQKEEEPQESPQELRRFWYGSKADADDRLNSKHPTVKPVDLMQWLVRLVCPKGATVLDPFAGTGTTGAASFIEGRRCVLIEREAEYLADIERRMELLLSGRDERSWKLAKPESMEALPLFAGKEHRA